ncbi:hypothetical protein, partial [Agilicoccus flavus]|uniref:hypothetical protein n=1 Tax=Agilicoccus flavus TaxID=2775968 RepID=UPI001CF62E11
PIIDPGSIGQRHGHQVSRFSAPCRGKELRSGVSPQPDAQGADEPERIEAYRDMERALSGVGYTVLGLAWRPEAANGGELASRSERDRKLRAANAGERTSRSERDRRLTRARAADLAAAAGPSLERIRSHPVRSGRAAIEIHADVLALERAVTGWDRANPRGGRRPPA